MRLDLDTQICGRPAFSGPARRSGHVVIHRSRTLRGGRMTKWKGEAASYAPQAGFFSCVARWATIRLLPLALLAGLTAAPALADELWWDPNGSNPGLGGTGAWNTADPFWSWPTVGLTIPDGISGPWQAWDNASLHDAYFANTAGTITLAGPISAHSLTFQNMNGWVLTGGTLTLDGVAPYISNAGTVRIDSQLTALTGLTKDGGGALTVNGATSINGGLTVNAGTLTLNGNTNLDAAPVVNGGTLFHPGDGQCLCWRRPHRHPVHRRWRPDCQPWRPHDERCQ
jgi:fibronectin-binding autotransporter adhesin